MKVRPPVGPPTAERRHAKSNKRAATHRSPRWSPTASLRSLLRAGYPTGWLACAARNRRVYLSCGWVADRIASLAPWRRRNIRDMLVRLGHMLASLLRQAWCSLGHTLASLLRQAWWSLGHMLASLLRQAWCSLGHMLASLLRQAC